MSNTPSSPDIFEPMAPDQPTQLKLTNLPTYEVAEMLSTLTLNAYTATVTAFRSLPAGHGHVGGPITGDGHELQGETATGVRLGIEAEAVIRVISLVQLNSFTYTAYHGLTAEGQRGDDSTWNVTFSWSSQSEADEPFRSTTHAGSFGTMAMLACLTGQRKGLPQAVSPEFAQGFTAAWMLMREARDPH